MQRIAGISICLFISSLSGLARAHGEEDDHHHEEEEVAEQIHGDLAVGFHTGLMVAYNPWMHNAVHIGVAFHGDFGELEVGMEVGYHYYFDTDHTHLASVHSEEDEEEEHHGSDSHLEWGPVFAGTFTLTRRVSLFSNLELHLLPAIEGSFTLGPMFRPGNRVLIGGGLTLTMLELTYDPIDNRIETVDRYMGGFLRLQVPYEGAQESHLHLQFALYRQSMADELGTVYHNAAAQLLLGVDFH